MVEEFLRRTQRAEASLLHYRQYSVFFTHVTLFSAYAEVLDGVNDAEGSFHLRGSVRGSDVGMVRGRELKDAVSAGETKPRRAFDLHRHDLARLTLLRAQLPHISPLK